MHGSPVPLVPHPLSDDDAEALLAPWQRLTRAALDAQARGRSATALRQYRQALVIAESLLDDPGWIESVDDVLAALVVSHHNLSDLLDVLDRPTESTAHLCAPHLRLLGMDHVEQEPAIRAATWRHLGETRRQLMLRRQQLDDDSQPAAAIDHALAALPPGITQH